MDVVIYELIGFLYIFSFMISLISLLYLYQIITKTNQLLKKGYLLMFFSVLVFSIWMALFVMSHFQISNLLVYIGPPMSIIFVNLLIIGIWTNLEIIKDIADKGQILMMVNKKNYNRKIGSLLKQSKKICYLFFTKEPLSSHVKKQIGKYSSLVVTDNKDITSSDVVYVDQVNPDSIKKVLNNNLLDENFDMVIFDGLTSIEPEGSTDLAHLVHQFSQVVKKHNISGYYIVDSDQINKSTIDDISKIIDMVKT